MREEGWYLDPFGAHEHRWFSDGWPTALVRDAGVETQDVPPSPTWDQPVEAPESVEDNGGADLFRVDAPSPASAAWDDRQVELEYRRRVWWDPTLPW